MKLTRLLILFLIAAVSVSVASPVFAQDAASVFKSKCAMCHGAEGQGKIGPALKGTSLSSDQIVALLTKGDEAKKPPHKKPLSGLSDADAKAVADYVKSLK